MKIDMLAFGAHPDDVELSSCGTLMVHIANGGSAGIVDLTRGELGSRGDADTRIREAEAASGIIGLSFRKNLGLADGFFRAEKDTLLKIISVIREHQPEIILANAMADRHPDHGRAGHLLKEACFLSGLRKISTTGSDGKEQQHWRPKAVYHYVQDYYMKPDVVVDITSVWDRKIQAIQAFSSQFWTGKQDNQPSTPISSKSFLDFIEARAREWGRPIGVEYGEAFTVERVTGVRTLTDLL